MILATTEPSRRRLLTIHSSRNYFVPAKCGTKSVPHFASTTQFGLIQALGRMDTIAANGRMRKRELTLSQYILRRNGVPAGARGSLRNMFQRSLGASTFAGFWRHRSEEHTSALQSLMRYSYAVFCLKTTNSTKQNIKN